MKGPDRSGFSLMKSTLGLITAGVLGLFLTTTVAEACNVTVPCAVEEGDYLIALPDDADGPIPAVIFIHGYGSSAQGVMRNTGLTSAFLDRGYAVVAPNGMQRQNGNGRSWSFHPDRPQRRDEAAFLLRVRDDVIARHSIRADRILLSGFSIGGSVTSYVACQVPDSFAAYAPVGGSFWRPHPTECAGPVRLFHTHGWKDVVVPLEGRAVNNLPVDDPDAFVQGDVFHAMDIWRQTNGCLNQKPDSFAMNDVYWIRKWESCRAGTALEFALHPGGHSIPSGWAEMAMDWFEAL